MKSSRLPDATLAIDIALALVLVGVVAVGVYMGLGKSVQARVAITTQKMVGSVSHVSPPMQIVRCDSMDKFPGFNLLAFEFGQGTPRAILYSGFEHPNRLTFFLLDESKLKKNEHYRTLRNNDPRLVPVDVEEGISGSDWKNLTLEKRPDGSYILKGPVKPSPQAANTGGGNAP
jgi:hypothetical protein